MGPMMRSRLVLFVVTVLLSSPGAVRAQFAQPYQIHGSSDLDFAACSQDGPVGRLTGAFWILRRYDIAGPTFVTLKNLPPGVTAAISPDTLTYPGWVTGQQATVTLTVNAGAPIPDVIVELQVDDGKNHEVAELLLHGTCPRHNRDFTIRGAFSSIQLGVSFPVEGALVEIYREVPWQLDQWVGSTITDGDGRFDVKLYADREDTYYAKLRLTDVAGVYLHDWWTPSIKDFNSFNRGSNAQPLIDVGLTVVSRDGGQGTPRTAVWQGGRAAFQEFRQTFQSPPPTGDYEIVNQNTLSGMTWTARSTTNYEEGTTTYKYSSGTPDGPASPGFHPYLSQFTNYSTNFHEFGHALRHTIDGDQRHFTDDATRWTYARSHSLCGSAGGYVDIEAFAFNEGWAEFWSLDTGPLFRFNCGSVSPTDMTKEGAVMNDLHLVAQAIDACQPLVATVPERVKAERRNMFAVLNRGSNIIHSEGEFRSNAAQQFSGCALPAIGAGIAPDPLQQPGRVRAQAVVDLAARLRARTEFYRTMSQTLDKDLRAATAIAAQASPCLRSPCSAFVAAVVGPAVTRGRKQYADVVARMFSVRYDELTRSRTPEREMTSILDRDTGRREELRRATVAIVHQTIVSAAAALERYVPRDRSGELRDIVASLRRTDRRIRMRGPLNDEVFTMLVLPSAPDDDVIGPGR